MYDLRATDVLSAFPRRPLVLRPPPAPWAGRILSILSGFVAVGLVIASLIWIAPPLRTDWAIRDTATQVRGRVENGQCLSKLIFHLCAATLITGTARTLVQTDVFYLFADVHAGDYTLEVMADPERPALLTTDLGLDKLFNRAVSLLALWLLLAIGVAFGARAAWRPARMRRAVLAASAQLLAPVRLDLYGVGGSRFTARWTVRDAAGRQSDWAVPAKATPFRLGTGTGILGIALSDEGLAFPLDAALCWIELTEAERAQIFAAQAQYDIDFRHAEAAFRMDHP